jgi:hypothetical protein
MIRHVEIRRWGTSRSGSSKRRRLRGQTAITMLADKGAMGLETLVFDGGVRSSRSGGGQGGQGQILRRSARRG